LRVKLRICHLAKYTVHECDDVERWKQSQSIQNLYPLVLVGVYTSDTSY